MIRLDNLYGLYELGTRIQKMSDTLNSGTMSIDVLLSMAEAKNALLDVLTEKILPLEAAKESAQKLIDLLLPFSTVGFFKENREANWLKPIDKLKLQEIEPAIIAFQYALSEELRQLPTYTVTEKGNLSRTKLIEGASNGYSQKARDLADNFILLEINESGRCLAFGLFTASGFHILRAVEICIKGYIYAVNGELPKLRNWGKYIEALEKAGATTDLVDLVKVLKAKRNPLMHPQDTLEQEDAIDLFSVSQAVIQFLAKEVFDKKIDTKFKEALKTSANLPPP